jgi:hypothetical protein
MVELWRIRLAAAPDIPIRVWSLTTIKPSLTGHLRTCPDLSRLNAPARPDHSLDVADTDDIASQGDATSNRDCGDVLVAFGAVAEPWR